MAQSIKLIKGIILIFLVVLCQYSLFPDRALGEETKKDYNYPQDHFSISLPDNWIEIPSDFLVGYARGVNELRTDNVRVHYEYGFQPDTVKEWLGLPYILISVVKDKRVTKQELDTMVEKMKDRIERGEGDFPSIMTDMKGGEKVYDPEKHILWMNATVQHKLEGTLRSLTGMFFTNNGFIQINGVVREDDYSQYKKVLEEILNSVEIEESMQYKTRLIDYVPFLQKIEWDVILSFLVGAVIVLGVLIIVQRFFKRKKKKTSFPEE